MTIPIFRYVQKMPWYSKRPFLSQDQITFLVLICTFKMPRLLRNNQASRPDVAYDVSHNLCGPSSTCGRTKGFSRYFGLRLKTPLMKIGWKRSWTQGKEECGHLQTHILRDEKQWPSSPCAWPVQPSSSLPFSRQPSFSATKTYQDENDDTYILCSIPPHV